MRARALSPVLALALFAAGCVTLPEDVETAAVVEAAWTSSTRLPVPDVDFSKIVVADHGAGAAAPPNAGHAARRLHGGIEGMEVVGWSPLIDKTPAGAVGTGWGAIGIWKNYACVAQLAGSGSVAIVDIADPAKPVVTGQTADLFVNGDCEFTKDGKYLFAGAYIGVPTPGSPTTTVGPVVAKTTGVAVWNVEDKTAPKLVLYSNTGEYHTHFLHTNENGTYLVQAYSGNIYKFDGEAATLEKVAQIQPMDHDMWISEHLITGQTLLYSGAGEGVVVYDFDDPERPEQIGEWQPEKGTRTEAWHRQATVDKLVDGKMLLVAAGENCSDGKTEPYAVFDITDPSTPTLLSEWELPGKPEAKGANLCTFSPHEFSVFDGYVASGNYHAGVWLWDVGSTERAAAPPTLGYFIPSNEPVGPRAGTLPFPWTPFVWGAFFDERGYVLTADASSGLYVLKIPGVTQEG